MADGPHLKQDMSGYPENIGSRTLNAVLVDIRERTAVGEHPRAVVEAVDAEPLGSDTLQYL